MRLSKGCHLLVRVVYIILPLSLHCKGSERHPGYSIEVDTYVSVQENQCVTIPCTFTADYKTSFQYSSGYWMQDPQTVVAYNKKWIRNFEEKLKPNFRVTGDSDKGNCTLTITDAKKEDSGDYYFRFQRIKGFNYLERSVKLEVKELTDKPEIRQSGLLVAGQEVTLTCIAVGNCPEARPSILWRKSDRAEVWGKSSNITFSPKPSDHQMNITCEVKFSTANTSVVKTLEVLYPPQEPQIMVSSSNGAIHFTDGVVYIHDDEPLTLNCSADGNPPAKVMWSKGAGQQLPWSVITTDFSLENTYRCLAYNDYGESEKHLKTIIQAVPQEPEVIIMTSKEIFRSSESKSIPNLTMNKGDSITCLVNSNFSVHVIWGKGDDIQASSKSREVTINVTSQGNYRCSAWNRFGITTKSLRISLSVRSTTIGVIRTTVSSDGDTAPLISDGNIFHLLIGMLGGMVIIIAFLLVFKLITKKRLKWKAKYSSTKNCPPTEDAADEDPNQIYMNIGKPVPISEDTKDEDMQEDTISLPKDQEDLHYSTIVFPDPPTKAKSEQPETEYAEIQLNQMDQ